MDFPAFGGASKPPDPRKVLDAEGPQFPETFNMSDFSMIAYVRGGWPMVIDFQLEQPAIVLLTIAADGIEPFYYHLDARNIARHQEKLTIPARFGDAATPAKYSIRALGATTGEVKPVYLRLFGLGAGPRAVGSLKIDDLRFTPGTIHTAQQEKANYSFHSHDDFTKAEAEFWSVGRLPGGPVIPTRMDVEKIKNVVHRDEQVASSWEGKHKGKPLKGQFQLQVCGWVEGKLGGDWGLALSGQLVNVD
jgi:hypothetical protein